MEEDKTLTLRAWMKQIQQFKAGALGYATLNHLDAIGATWPLPWLLGILSFFPPIHATVYWWARKRYRLLKTRLQPR